MEKRKLLIEAIIRELDAAPYSVLVFIYNYLTA